MNLTFSLPGLSDCTDDADVIKKIFMAMHLLFFFVKGGYLMQTYRLAITLNLKQSTKDNSVLVASIEW